jgi:hypothetical protein
MSFDDLCLDPEPNLKKLFDFVGDDGQGFDMNSLKGLIRAPSSIGRYKEYDYRSKFSGEQLQAVESLGFSLD